MARLVPHRSQHGAAFVRKGVASDMVALDQAHGFLTRASPVAESPRQPTSAAAQNSATF
jgi:hypothetical protein